jgi:predicted kinase
MRNQAKNNLFLLQMAGTSGVGKSTLAQKIAQQTAAVVIDYDVIKSLVEQNVEQSLAYLRELIKLELL